MQSYGSQRGFPQRNQQVRIMPNYLILTGIFGAVLFFLVLWNSGGSERTTDGLATGYVSNLATTLPQVSSSSMSKTVSRTSFLGNATFQGASFVLIVENSPQFLSQTLAQFDDFLSTADVGLLKSYEFIIVQVGHFDFSRQTYLKNHISLWNNRTISTSAGRLHKSVKTKQFQKLVNKNSEIMLQDSTDSSLPSSRERKTLNGPFIEVILVERWLDDGVGEATRSGAYNAGLMAASHSLVVFFTDNTVPEWKLNDNTLVNELFGTLFQSSANVGAVGCRLQTTAGQLHSAGLTFEIGSDVYSYFRSEWKPISTQKEDTVNSVLPALRFAGFSISDARANLESPEELVALVPSAFAVDRNVVIDMGGFNSTYGWSSGFYLDLFLRMKFDKGFRILYSSKCTATVHSFGVNTVRSVSVLEDIQWKATDGFIRFNEEKRVEDEKRLFQAKWRPQLISFITEGYVLQNITLAWSMECGSGQVLGFTIEAVNFVMALKDKLSVIVDVTDGSRCLDELNKAGLPSSVIQTLWRLANKVPTTANVVLIIHHDPGRYSYFKNRFSYNPFYVIGRSMYETDRIPEDWLSNCVNNSLVQTIWVPSQFNRQTFNNSGVPLEKLVQIPEPIDTFLFDAASLGPTQSALTSKRRKFNFFSSFKWEERKGWKILLKAFFEEFSEVDNVTLFLRTTPKLGEYNAFYDEFRRGKRNLTSSEVATTTGPQKRLPEVVFISNLLPASILPRLYSEMDCFVLPTHGEGWGLPVVEAMSMGLPVIATNWSGTTQFLRETNSFAIEVEELIERQDKHKWAKPSLKHLKQLMRFVLDNPQKAQEVAKAGQQSVRSQFSLSKVADLVLEQVRKLTLPTPITFSHTSVSSQTSTTQQSTTVTTTGLNHNQMPTKTNNQQPTNTKQVLRTQVKMKLIE